MYASTAFTFFFLMCRLENVICDSTRLTFQQPSEDMEDVENRHLCYILCSKFIKEVIARLAQYALFE